MDFAAVIFIIAALIVGLGLGWFLGGRGAAVLAAEKADLSARLDVATEQRNAAFRDIAVEQERANQASTLRERLDLVQGERESALRELAALRSEQSARAESFQAQIKALTEAKEQLSAQFSEIGGKLLGEAQKAFLENADRSFAQANEKGEAQLKTLLQPVETTLKRYEEGLQRVEKDRIGSYNELREAVRQVHLGQGEVRTETAKLINALRAAPKTRGRWGEQQFKNLIETAGLSPFVDFREEVSVGVEGGTLRPDFVIRLPGDQQLVVDVKCSLEAYLNAVDQTEQASRDRYLADHARAVRTHADALGRKAYWEQFEKAPDFVIMYVPGDNFVTRRAGGRYGPVGAGGEEPGHHLRPCDLLAAGSHAGRALAAGEDAGSGQAGRPARQGIVRAARGGRDASKAAWRRPQQRGGQLQQLRWQLRHACPVDGTEVPRSRH